MSELVTNKITPSTGSSDTVTLGDSGDTFTIPSGVTMTNSGTATGFGGGIALQCLSVTQTGVLSSTVETTWTDITGLSLTITPAAVGSKILLMFNGNVNGDQGGYNYGIGFVRDSTLLGLGDADGVRTRVTHAWDSYNVGGATSIVVGYHFIDAPSTTSATTYKVQFYSPSGGATFYLNGKSDTSHAGYMRGGSTFTIMELSAATVTSV